MPQEKGILIPLANYRLEPIAALRLHVDVPRKVVSAESAMKGRLPFTQPSAGMIEFTLPLENNDFVTLMFD